VLQDSDDDDYAYELDCNDHDLDDVYHYVQATLSDVGTINGLDTFECYEFLQRDGTDFKTIQIQAGKGVKLINYGAGKVSSMTKDDGSVYIPPVTVQFTFTLNPNITHYEYRIYQVDAVGSLTGANELQGIEDADTNTYTYSYTYDGTDIVIAVQILPHANDYIESETYYTLSDTDQSVTIDLKVDINN